MDKGFNGNPFATGAIGGLTTETTEGGSPARSCGPTNCVRVPRPWPTRPPLTAPQYHYLPDDHIQVACGGNWLFRENNDNTPAASYGESSSVPSILAIR